MVKIYSNGDLVSVNVNSDGTTCVALCLSIGSKPNAIINVQSTMKRNPQSEPCAQRKYKKAKITNGTNNFLGSQVGKPLMIFHLGTNNWNREEFAPGSGILHEAHHVAYNSLPNVKCYSIYPSQTQSPHPDPTVKVFKLSHPVPICESVSPVSNYRWHSINDKGIAVYIEKLEKAVYEQMAAAEKTENNNFSLAFAHHTFLNTLILRNVLRRRKKEGNDKTILACFIHGTGLKMYMYEKEKTLPDEFPLRFFPMIQKEKIFDSWEQDGVKVCYAISKDSIKAFLSLFPSFPKERIIYTPNGINQEIIHPIKGCTPANVLSEFRTVSYTGSSRTPMKIDSSKYKNLILFIGRFAPWKRVQAVLYAAKLYEKDIPGTATVIVGSGSTEVEKQLQDLAFEELKLEHTYFVGQQPYRILPNLYSAASVGVFPSFEEPFGLVFIDCMACGTPVIGAKSGGPMDFVTSSVGELVPETDDLKELGTFLNDAIQRAIHEDWKSNRTEACLRLVQKKYTVKGQCSDLIRATSKLFNFA